MWQPAALGVRDGLAAAGAALAFARAGACGGTGLHRLPMGWQGAILRVQPWAYVVPQPALT